MIFTTSDFSIKKEEEEEEEKNLKISSWDLGFVFRNRILL